MSVPSILLKLLILCVILYPAAVTSAPTRLAISDGGNNRDLTLSPDGRWLLTTLMAPRNQYAVIVMAQRQSDQWAALTVASFSGQYADIEPMFSPDGSRVFFASKRPHRDNDGSHWDLWSVSFAEDGQFGMPEPLPAPINTPGDEFYPSVTEDGVIYFTSAREGSLGREDIFRAIPSADGYQIMNVGTGVNSASWEFNAFVAPDASFLVFSSQGRGDDNGGGDLYISYRDQTGEFGPARNLGAGVNSNQLDYCPFVHGEWLYFSSNRQELILPAAPLTLQEIRGRFNSPGNGLGDLYRISREMLKP